jgi:hypothetical protein
LLIFLPPRRSTSARAVQRLAPHSAGTRSVLQDTSGNGTPPPHSHRLFLPFFRAPGGVVNLAATLGNNMCAGAPARSTFPTKHPSRRVSTLTRHDGGVIKAICPLLARGARRTNGECPAQQNMLHFLFVRAYCHEGEHYWGRTVLQERERKKEKKKKSYNKSHLRCIARADVRENER